MRCSRTEWSLNRPELQRSRTGWQRSRTEMSHIRPKCRFLGRLDDNPVLLHDSSGLLNDNPVLLRDNSGRLRDILGRLGDSLDRLRDIFICLGRFFIGRTILSIDTFIFLIEKGGLVVLTPFSFLPFPRFPFQEALSSSCHARLVFQRSKCYKVVAKTETIPMEVIDAPNFRSRGQRGRGSTFT